MGDVSYQSRLKTEVLSFFPTSFPTEQVRTISEKFNNSIKQLWHQTQVNTSLGLLIKSN